MMNILQNLGEIVEKHDRSVTMMNECLSKMFNRHVDETIRIEKSMNRMVSGLEIL